MSSAARTRRYRSPLRAEQAASTRAAILDAASTLFNERGWQVGIREIAAAAGCSVETIYSGFGSKLGLLRAVMDVSIVGDDEPIPLADRPEFVALGTGSRQSRIAMVARLALRINQSSGGSELALIEAGRTDPQAALEVTGMRTRIATTQRQAFTLVFGYEPDDQSVLDIAVAASPSTYRLLTEECGLGPDEYVAWLERQITGIDRSQRRRNA